jgi:hypothetical protein
MIRLYLTLMAVLSLTLLFSDAALARVGAGGPV